MKLLWSAAALAIACAVSLTSGPATAHGQYGHGQYGQKKSFQRIATFANYRNNTDIAEETVSEIVAVSKDGRTLVYTDSPGEAAGFVDISDPSNPQPAGKLALNGEPTSVDVLGDEYALVAVNTSADYVNVGGELVVIELATQTVKGSVDLGGQPDSIKISPDGKYVAVAIENERDEDVVVDGVEGGLPQLPAGYLVIVDIVGSNPEDWTRRDVDLTGLASYGTDDPEPEFVDVNENNEAVVTLQENNHVAVVDLASGDVVKHFDLGAVDLVGIDATEDGVISLTDSLEGVPREPDAVAWIPGAGGYSYHDRRCKKGRYKRGCAGGDLIATANEGDLFGGSRGFSIFDRAGEVLYDSAASYEEIAVRYGHYPEDRSENKGSEPESIEYGRFGDTDYLFVGSERGSFIVVYELDKNRDPQFLQLLPGPLGPEGLLAVPEHNLLIASGEEDDPSYGVRSSIMIYALADGGPSYPQILSADKNGKPIGWSAMSGMTSVPGYGNRDKVLAVWDSYYSVSKIFTIDAGEEPVVVVDELAISGGSGDYDPEGIAVAPDGSYWVASEGNASGSRRNRLLQVDPASGAVMQEIGLPPEIEACRAASANTGSLGSGFEGVAILRGLGGYKLLVAQQRGWDYTTPECESLDDDPDAMNSGEPSWTRIWIYDPADGSWDHIPYELEPLPAHASWVGLSEISEVGFGSYILIERDNRSGDFAELKTLVKINRWEARDGISRDEKKVYEMIPDLKATNGWITDKPEGVAVMRNGRVKVITDNDGVEDWSGETWFLDVGPVWRLFR